MNLERKRKSMTIKDLKKWFKEIPDKFLECEIEDIDVDYTRDTNILNLVLKVNGKVIIKSLYLSEKYND